MITRRNIREKVLQSIYETTLQLDNEDASEALKTLDKKLAETHAMLTAAMKLLQSVGMYVQIYANQRASKLRPTQEDLQVNTKLANNRLWLGFDENQSFKDNLKKYKLNNFPDEDLIRSVFLSLIETDTYKEYCKSPEHQNTDDKKMVRFMANHCLFQNEWVYNYMTEHFPGWYTDESMLESWIDKIIQSPMHFGFSRLISADKLEFAHELLKTYYQKHELVFALIEPKLENWDADRVAMIDFILLHLGICELLYFPTIPVKVTINEYIDLAKSYSTPQSGQFVNGLLDNVHKELIRENKIHKEHFTKS